MKLVASTLNISFKVHFGQGIRVDFEDVCITTNTLLPYSTISSHLMSQSSDFHKLKSWGHKPFAYTFQWRQMRWIGRIHEAVTA
jgi:hypothetical protein